MSISIVTCPKCGTFLLSDSAQCHRCRLVIHPERANQYRDSSLPTDAAIQQDMERCRQCGEACRKGLVRCWSCGAFTRPEIEAAYYRLLQGHERSDAQTAQRYELPEISQKDARKQFWAVEDREREKVTSAQTAEYTALDDDFELTGNLSLTEGVPNLGNDTTDSDPIPFRLEAPPPALAAPIAPVKAAEPTPKPAAAAAPATPTPPKDDADSLLSIAKQEQSAVQKSRRAKLGEGFVIFCPMGCKIRVQERHRGKIGRCPKCQATFVVPMAKQVSVSGSVPAHAGENSVASPAEGAASSSGQKFSRWLHDVHLHQVAPQKLRIKADSLLKEFQEIDLGFDPSGLLMVGLKSGGGMFGGKNAKKIDVARAAVIEHLATKGTADDVPAGFKQVFSPDAVSQISLTQPASPGAESLFGDIPVFGTGRIAVRLPKFDDKTTAYLSFSLSQFREFSRALAESQGIESFGSGCGVPLQDEYRASPCHFSKQPVKELQNLTYYQKDPAFKLEIAGYRCKICQTVISEAARAGQKLGGANGKGIAKAKCPKCTKPLGNQPLYQAPAGEMAQSADETAPAESSAAMPEPTAV